MADITNLRSPAEAGLSKLFESARRSFATEEAIAREEAWKIMLRNKGKAGDPSAFIYKKK